jgi:hypothetical protein
MGQIQKGEDPRSIDVTYIFCKQLFAPWENIDDDPVSIDLIYAQIIHGLSLAFMLQLKYKIHLHRYSSWCLYLQSRDRSIRICLTCCSTLLC